MAFSSSTDFEKKVDCYLKSSSKLNALEANRLEMHWKKLCEQEQISKKRNNELLKDFERVAQQALVFDSRTQSLKAAKKKYEDFINLMYPRWKEELEHHRLLTQSNREKIPKNVYEGRNKEREHTQTSFPSQSTRGESGPLSKSSYHSPDTRGYFFPPSQLDKSSNRSHYGKDPMNEHINENSHWDPNSFRNQSFGRDFMEPSHSVPNGSRSGSYHERFHDSFYRAKVADENRTPLSSFERFDEKNYQRYEYHDNEMPQHRPYPQQGYPYSRTYHEGQQPHNGNNRHQGFKDLHSPNNDFENRIYQEHSYNNPWGHGRYSPPGHKMYDRGGYGVSYGSEPRRQMEGYHELIGNGMERSGVSQYNTPSDYLPGNGDQKHYNKDNKGHLEVFERHSEQSSDLVDGSRTEALAGSKAVENSRQHTANNETTEPSKNVAENLESARKKVIGQTDLIDLADPRAERLSKEVVYSSNHEKLDQISRRKSEGGINERPNNLFIDTKNNEDYRTRVTRQKDSSIDTLNKVIESKQEIAEGIETMKVDSSMNDDEDGNEEYVFPAREDPEVAEGFVNPSKDRGKLSKQLETVEKPVRESVERSLSDDSMTEWTKERSEGDGDFEDVSELSLPDGTTGQSQTKNAAEEKLTDEGKEKRTAIESKHNTVPGSSVVAENVISTSRHKEDSSEVISKEENPFVDRNNKNKDNTMLEHSVQERDQLAEERDIHNLEERKLPAVTEDALISLLQFVDGDLEVSFSPETIYRSPACSSDMKEEIIKCALNGASLENFDPSTVSMIVLQELPLFVRNTESAALITDDTLKLSSKIQKEQNLRSEIRSSLRIIWKVLFLHLVKLVVNNVMTLREVGVLFSPLILQENSQYVSQAEMLLTRLIKDAVENGAADLDNEKENLLPSLSLTGDGVSVSQDGDHIIADKLSHSSEDTSSTFSGTPPIKSVTVDTLEPGARPRSEESLYSYEDDFDDDVPLTKTTSYQKLMSSTKIDEVDDVSDNISQSGRSKHSTEIVSEADEDLERQLERSISPPAITSPRQHSLRQKGSEKKKGKQRPKLSVFNDGASLGLSYGSGDLGESWDSEHGRTLTSSMKSDLASSLSPPLSPDPSYVPSAMEGERSNFKLSQPSEKKSELKSINKAVKRKPGFWNQSDTESEVDLQLSTGGNPLDDEIDDFDFYG